MVRQDKHKSRVTAKGTRPEGAEASEISPRNTPAQDAYQPSPSWVPILMGLLLVLGVLMILLNYVDLLPGAPSNWYLLGGLGLVLGGIVTATQYR
jgi:hypothetical protein